MASVPGLDMNVFIGVIPQIAYWTGVTLGGIIVSLGLYSVYFYFSFPIKLHVIPIYGSVEDKRFSIGKPKTNKARWNKTKTAWIYMFPIFGGKENQPIENKYQYPGKQYYVFDDGETYHPIRIKGDVDNAQFEPIPYSVREWQSLTHKKNAVELSKPSWWEENKNVVYSVIIGLGCLAACVATIWLTYKFAAGNTAEMRSLTTAIKSIGQIK